MPRAGRQGSQSNRSNHRLTDCKNQSKRGDRGYDAVKKIKGRKRHIVVDTHGLPLKIKVHTADVQDRDGAKLVLNKLKTSFPWLERIYADGGYAGDLERWAFEKLNCVLEIVRRSDKVKGFYVLPKRWIVERTFAWLEGFRRLSKDFEELIETSEAFIKLAYVNLMLKRLA
jgi:putative transposase